MPIFDQGYQHWEGQLSGHGWRWLAIARRGVRSQLKNRWMRLTLLLAWGPALVLAAFLAIWGLAEQYPLDFGPFLGPFLGLFGLPNAVSLSPKEFRGPVWTIAFSVFLLCETFAAMIVVVIAGPNLISQDLRYNAMPLYLSRPLYRLDYFAGKLGTIGAFLVAVIIAPTLLAYLVGVGFSLSLGVIGDTYKIIPACLLYGLVVAAVAGLFMLAISSLSRNSRNVAVSWIGLWMIGSAVAGTLEGLRLKWGPLVSFTANLGRVRETLLGTGAAYEAIQEGVAKKMSVFGGLPFGAPPRLYNPFAWDYPWQWSAYVLLGLVGLSLWILTTRVKSLDRLR